MSIVQQLERVPPQNLEAEQGVLGSMLLDRDAIARAIEGLRAEDFYRDAHRVIFQAMVELFERGEPVDLITVTNRLTQNGKLEDVGGPTYVASLPNMVPTAANVDFYANIVLEKSMLRALISAGTHIAAMGYDGADDVAAMIDHAEKLVFGIASRRSVQDFEAIKEILKQSFEKIDRRYQEKGTITGVGTGFSDFDMLTSGLQPADMVIIAARPSVGKTTLALNIAQHAALGAKIPVAIFSLETSKEQLVQRILCSEAQVDNSKLRTGFLADEDWRKLARAMGGLSEAPIFIDDSATMSIIEMRAKARKLKAEHGLGLIVIDYIQMIQSYKRSENRTQELSEIARGIKSLAKELDVPIIAISQLSRAVEALGQKRPMLSHLRECVTGDTAVWDADTGRQHTVAELASASNWPRLLSLDRPGKLVRVRPSAVIAKGENDVFEVLTRNGRRICATANHPLLTPTGWVAVKDLSPQSSVGVARWPATFDIDVPMVVAAGPRGAGMMRFQEGSTGSSIVSLAERLGAKQAAELAVNDVLWDQVAAIKPSGRAPVYDLVMPGTHNFVANGLVVHNSGEIEQVSDLVVFLYREDYYDQEKAQKENKENICELIIAKHRNGPIGTVELYFHKEYSRFANLEKRRQ
ncbi:MAG: replicative DNA helicase [bacterium]